MKCSVSKEVGKCFFPDALIMKQKFRFSRSAGGWGRVMSVCQTGVRFRARRTEMLRNTSPKNKLSNTVEKLSQSSDPSVVTNFRSDLVSGQVFILYNYHDDLRGWDLVPDFPKVCDSFDLACPEAVC